MAMCGSSMIKGTSILEHCSHSIVTKDLCGVCGADLQKLGQQNHSADIATVHNIPELRVSPDVAQLLGKADEERLVKARKLTLLVDLDHTLIHTTSGNIDLNIKDVFNLKILGTNSLRYHVRLRPHTREFLKNMSTLYELRICTFASRSYAHAIAKILDEEGHYFSNRILSREEFLSPHSKEANLKTLFPCGDHMVVIIDDRQDVWNFAPNLVHVRPYHFFRLTGDINSPLGSLRNNFSDIKLNDISEKEDQDSYLLYLQNTLRSIHHAYYAAHDEIVQKEVEESKKEIPDTKVIVPSVRRQVLQGVSLVFSWIVPINVPKDERRPYVLARSLGAFVTETVDNSTTHVVSNRLDTPEVLAAKKFKTIKIVTSEWLTTCADRWQHADERDFPLNSNTSVVRQEPCALSTSQDLLQPDAGVKKETEEILDPPIATCVLSVKSVQLVCDGSAHQNRVP